MRGAVPVHPEPKSTVKFVASQGLDGSASRGPSSPRKKPREPEKKPQQIQWQKIFQRIKKFKLRDPERMAWIRMKSRRLCNSWRFTMLTTALTIYALFGDDFRLCEEPKQETRVGKKLSDMTTRRVIILVLVMLLFLPQFDPAGNVFNAVSDFQDRTATSSTGPQHVRPWCLDALSTPSENQELHYRNRYELEVALLQFLHSHISGGFLFRLYWIGAVSRLWVDSTYLGQLAPLNQARWLGQDLRVDPASLDDAWKNRVEAAGPPEVGSAISTATKQRLINNWQEECQTAVGVVVQPEVRAMVSTGCSITAELRCSEVEYVTPLTYSSQESDSFSFVFAFDQRGFTQLEAAGLSIVQTLFICFAVGVGAMTFSKDANELLLNPIERMIEKMETIKDNPLEAMRLGDLEFRREEVEEARFREKLAQMSRPWQILYKYRHAKKYKEPMETVMLEKTIIKLGGLLALGFGEAGAEVIGQNMKVSATAGVNAMVPGSKVDAIIGFCNIRHFMEATEVLKEKVMLFVNQVGEIVHGCVDDFHGAPNRNIGDAFLVIWRLSGSSEEKQTKLADMALMSYVKIVAEVNKSRILAGYRWHPGFQYRIKDRVSEFFLFFPHLHGVQKPSPGEDFRVSMGFGLHHGWAIEGAIGSEYKIDASYLSPNVSVAAKLEAATSQFKVWMLLSHSMVNKCSHEVALSCRLIDQVTVSGSRIPMRIYTMDLDTRRTIAVEEKGPDRIIRNRFKIRQLREVRKGEKMAEDAANPDVSHMRALFSEEFFQRFHMAYRNYEEGHSSPFSRHDLSYRPGTRAIARQAGEWLAARDMLYTCHYQPRPDIGRRLVQSEADWPEDGPTVTLLKFMQQRNFQAPSDWLGYRELPDRSKQRWKLGPCARGGSSVPVVPEETGWNALNRRWGPKRGC
eukprot:g924.t1